MKVLTFIGAVVTGIGRHKELGVPGRDSLASAPSDWPRVLQPGSLNVRVQDDGYPPEFSRMRMPLTVESLDLGFFLPAFKISQAEFTNNRIGSAGVADGDGSAQVWRARLNANKDRIRCWVLRRFGSTLRHQLEIVSHEHIRDTYGLADERRWPGTLEVFGSWRAV